MGVVVDKVVIELQAKVAQAQRGIAQYENQVSRTTDKVRRDIGIAERRVDRSFKNMSLSATNPNMNRDRRPVQI